MKDSGQMWERHLAAAHQEKLSTRALREEARTLVVSVVLLAAQAAGRVQAVGQHYSTPLVTTSRNG